MKRFRVPLFLALACSTLSMIGSAAPVFELGNDTLPSNITNTTASVQNVSTTVTLTTSSRHLIIKTDPAAAVIYVDLTGGTATSADFRIEPGSSLQIDGPPLPSFKYIGATATGTISTLAW